MQTITHAEMNKMLLATQYKYGATWSRDATTDNIYSVVCTRVDATDYTEQYTIVEVYAYSWLIECTRWEITCRVSGDINAQWAKDNIDAIERKVNSARHGYEDTRLPGILAFYIKYMYYQSGDFIHTQKTLQFCNVF